MRRPGGFGLSDSLVLAAVATILVFSLLVLGLGSGGCPMRELAMRTVCGTRLHGIYQGLHAYAYGDTAEQSFPRYGTPSATDVRSAFTGHVINEITTVASRAELQQNITATLWTLAKVEEVIARRYLCDSDSNFYIDRQLNTNGSPITAKEESWDFTAVRSERGAPLSFSVMDMYDPKIAHHWSPNVNADWVLLADDNNNDGSTAKDGAIHNTNLVDLESGGIKQADVEDRENSSHHQYEGQNVLFGDGHVTFENDPFVGPNGDNIYAVGPPTASRNVPKLTASPTHDGNDVYLIPITGNVGGASTLHPYD